MMLSTPNHSGLDINEWYSRGHQAVWHTRCPHCEALTDLSDPAEIFPDRSIVFNAGQIDGAPADEYCWICPVCQQFIADPQRGEYVSQNPSADPRIRSFLLPRTISPRITARDAVVGWNRAKGGDAKKSFYNRTLARPYVNVDELPVTLALCEACVEEGRLAGIEWQKSGSGCIAGIDNMGSHNVIVVMKRHTDGRPALVHVEDIWNIEPYDRCSEIMDQYGITCCVTESLPNYNSAMSFAHRHPGRVFLAGYGELRDQILIWDDDPLNRSERHTDEGSRNRHTVVLNQYRCMMQALHRIKDRAVLFPDPNKLEQMVPDGDGGWKTTSILYDVFGDFTRTALVVQEDPDTRKRRARVIKNSWTNRTSTPSLISA